MSVESYHGNEVKDQQGQIIFGNTTPNSGQIIKSNGNNVTWGNASSAGVNAIQGTGNIGVSANTGSIVISNNHSHSGVANQSYVNSQGFGTGNGNSNLSIGNGANNAAPGSHANSGHHNHSGTVLTTAGLDNLYSGPHNHPYLGNSHANSNGAHSSAIASAILQHKIEESHSDERLKENIADTTLGLDFINKLQPRDFNWKSSYLDNEYSDENEQQSKFKTLISNTQQGFVAQEVKTAVFDATGSNTAFGGLKIGDMSEADKGYTGDADDFGRVDYTQFISPLVKSVQQLSAKIEVLQARVDELEGS